MQTEYGLRHLPPSIFAVLAIVGESGLVPLPVDDVIEVVEIMMGHV